MKMKKRRKRVTAFLLTMSMVASTLAIQPVDIQAAAKKAKTIVLNAKSQELYVGQKVSLSVKKVIPSKASKAVTWTTSNKKIATVTTSGKVVAKKVGKVKITAISKNNKKVKAVCRLTIKKKATAIALNVTDTKLNVGQTLNLKLQKITPANAFTGVSWTTSDKQIATVTSSGKVTAKACGTVKITATIIEKL